MPLSLLVIARPVYTNLIWSAHETIVYITFVVSGNMENMSFLSEKKMKFNFQKVAVHRLR